MSPTRPGPVHGQRSVKTAREGAPRRCQSRCAARRPSGRRGGGEACVGARISLAQGFIPDGEAAAATSEQKKYLGADATLPDPHREGPWLQHQATSAPLGRARSARHVMEAKRNHPPAPARARPLPSCLWPPIEYDSSSPRRRVASFRCGRTLHALGRLFHHKRNIERWFTQTTESRRFARGLIRTRTSRFSRLTDGDARAITPAGWRD